MAKVGIAGTTTWGTTLALVLARQGLNVHLWARTDEEAEKLRTENQNSRFLPGVIFPDCLVVTSSAQDAFGGADLVIIAVPSRSMRDNVAAIQNSIRATAVVVSATKGLELKTSKRMSQILRDELTASLHSGICILSGPNLALEIVQGKPSSTVIASENPDAATTAQALITSPRFRVYTNDDVIGVEFAGALKNIIAVGAGICDGLSYGDNAKAAFVTRGLAEIARLGIAEGANPMTFAGLAGMGDLIATCASPLSRNHHVGEQLAKGKSPLQILDTMNNVAEGVDTTPAAVDLAANVGVEMPITQAMFDVLFGGVTLEHAISNLLGRTPRPE